MYFATQVGYQVSADSSLVQTGDQDGEEWTDLNICSCASYLCFVSRTSLLTQTYKVAYSVLSQLITQLDYRITQPSYVQLVTQSMDCI